ncbi:fringe glycosyltransferase-like [Tubulanus polymorphus]|uniref:fringe glycosyltransferase-like n=1 Tax=Tubulanus polymorphus TaxID=672921 RepID=UPI003DA39398
MRHRLNKIIRLTISVVSMMCCLLIVAQVGNLEESDNNNLRLIIDRSGAGIPETIVKKTVSENHDDSSYRNFVRRTLQKTERNGTKLYYYVKVRRKIPAAAKLRLDHPNNRIPLTATTRPTEISDLFISVKTTKKYHRERLDVILNTWFKLAREQTHFFTDSDDHEYQMKTNGRMINTNCSASHNRKDLCCKMSAEYDKFISSNKRWFCHVDDDTYVNIPRLVNVLRKYNDSKPWYIGKPSLNHPIETANTDLPGHKFLFWFATGGAGFCLSRALALAMLPYSGGGKFQSVCNKIRLPDDCSIGYIITQYLKVDLTVEKDFHSHLEGLALLNPTRLHQYITLSYSPSGGRPNVINIPGFPFKDDPTRFYSIHCKLFPHLKSCPT